jgi:hypothetical protein
MALLEAHAKPGFNLAHQPGAERNQNLRPRSRRSIKSIRLTSGMSPALVVMNISAVETTWRRKVNSNSRQ